MLEEEKLTTNLTNPHESSQAPKWFLLVWIGEIRGRLFLTAKIRTERFTSNLRRTFADQPVSYVQKSTDAVST